MAPRVPNQAALPSHPSPRAAASRSLAAFASESRERDRNAGVATGRRQNGCEQKCARQRVSAPCCHSEGAVASDFIKGPVFVSRRGARWISCTLDCQPVVFFCRA